MKFPKEVLADSSFPIAQLITVGKRVAQWAQDLMFDLESIEHVRNGLKFRGTTLEFIYSFLGLFQEQDSRRRTSSSSFCS
jgi:adenylosuccinate lyase